MDFGLRLHPGNEGQTILFQKCTFLVGFALTVSPPSAYSKHSEVQIRLLLYVYRLISTYPHHYVYPLVCLSHFVVVDCQHFHLMAP
jgi:hypothetical protein